MGSPAAGIELLKDRTQRLDASSGQPLLFDTTALHGLHGFTAEPGRVSCLLPVTDRVRNVYGTLHGGCMATLVDTVGSAALVTLSKRSGMSLNINVNYLSPVPVGGTVVIEAEVVKVGKTIGTINILLRDHASGRVVAQGTHVKFLPAEGESAFSHLAEADTGNAASADVTAEHSSDSWAPDTPMSGPGGSTSAGQARL